MKTSKVERGKGKDDQDNDNNGLGRAKKAAKKQVFLSWKNVLEGKGHCNTFLKQSFLPVRCQ